VPLCQWQTLQCMSREVLRNACSVGAAAFTGANLSFWRKAGRARQHGRGWPPGLWCVVYRSRDAVLRQGWQMAACHGMEGGRAGVAVAKLRHLKNATFSHSEHTSTRLISTNLSRTFRNALHATTRASFTSRLASRRYHYRPGSLSSSCTHLQL
jgi:hypothetical protein